MTTEKRKRSTSELPISAAISAVRSNAIREQAQIAEVRAVYERKRLAILARVPEDFRGHVAKKANGPEPGPATIEGGEEPLSDEAKDADTGTLEGRLDAALEADDVPARLREPLNEKRLAIGKGR